MLASCDANAGANGITSPKHHVESNFNHLDPANEMVLFMMLSASFDANADATHIQALSRYGNHLVMPRYI